MDSLNAQDQRLLTTAEAPIPIPATKEHFIQIDGNREKSAIEKWATFLSILLVIATFPLSLFFCFKIVSEYQRAIILRMGRLHNKEAVGPGVYFVLPCIDEYCDIDLRTISFNVPPQGVLTRDSVTVTVDAVVYYRISDPLKATLQVTDYAASTQLLAATTLRKVIGMHNLSGVLANREGLSHSMQITLDDATEPWGVQVERVEIKDVALPITMQRAMAAEAEAQREARAKIIAAEGEMNASRALTEAAQILASSPAALQLRYLQTLNTISSEKNTTIIFPLPMDLITPFLNRS